MRTIGLIGGMSFESTLEYYRLINERTREVRGGLHSASSILYSFDFAEIEELQRSDRWDDAGARLAEAARVLERAGADLLVMCTNTMHKAASTVEAAVRIPLVHIVDATAVRIGAAGLRRVGVVATKYTMEDGFYADRLREHHGIDAIVPELEDRDHVHRVIYDELCRGVVREDSRRLYEQIVQRLVARGVEGIVLGCTEIELLLDPAAGTVPMFPTTRIHADAAVAAALG